MIDFYYQIKGKRGLIEKPSEDDVNYGWYQSTTWAFPPIFSGKVTAENRKKAKEIICENYGVNFPSRVLKKDLDSNEYLLSIEEIKPDSQLERLFELRKCIQCGGGFYVIDHYNNHNMSYKGYEYCSDSCRDAYKALLEFKRAEEKNQESNMIIGKRPVIYKISNRKTNMVYIGKTAQVFTLRWYQHFFQTGDNKFHQAIKASKVDDWSFEIVEVVDFEEIVGSTTDFHQIIDLREKHLLSRERYWIEFYDSVNKGYNSL